MGLETFLGLGTSIELFPAGVSSIIFVVNINQPRNIPLAPIPMHFLYMPKMEEKIGLLYYRQVSITDHFHFRWWLSYWGCLQKSQTHSSSSLNSSVASSAFRRRYSLGHHLRHPVPSGRRPPKDRPDLDAASSTFEEGE